MAGVTDADLIRRIRKLLAKGSNNPSAEEAQCCMLKAQELMVRHGLTIVDVEGDIAKKNVLDTEITGFRRHPWWHKSLSAVVADNFRCCSYIRREKGTGRTCICFIGFAEDVELGREVFSYAVNVITRCMKEYIARQRIPARNIRAVQNEYILGFLSGLKDRFAEQVHKNEWGLVLVKDAAVLEAIERKNLKNSRRPHITVAGDESARDAGYREGRRFDRKGCRRGR